MKASEMGPEGSPATAQPRNPMARAWLCLPALLFILLMALTQTPFTGDTFVYVANALSVRAGAAPPSTLWEFGHILWRPLACLLTPVFRAVIPDALAWNTGLKVAAGLILLNMLSGLIGALIVYDLSRRLMRSPLAALCPTVLFAAGDAVLGYSQSGTDYVFALAILLVGIWLQLVPRAPSVKLMVGSACLFGLAGLFWAPYVMAIPAASLTRQFVRLPGGERGKIGWRWSLISAVTAGVVALGGIVAAAALAGVHPSGFAAWMVAAGHGIRQNRRALRAISGIPRLLLDLSEAGVALKRFAFHDPYFPVSLVDIVWRCLTKLAAFYIFLAAVTALAWKSPAGRRALAVLAVAALPALMAAIFVFEPSAPERFLPVLPFLLLALAAGWNCPGRFAPAMRFVLWAFMAALLVLNLPGFEWKFSPAYSRTLAQVEDFSRSANPDDLLLTVTMAEPIIQLLDQSPFDPVNRTARIHALWVVDINPGGWRVAFASQTLDNWRHGHNVWIQKAALEDRPDATSRWVDGDAPNLHWRDIPAFFRGFEFDAQTARSDGFVRVRRSQANLAKLTQLLSDAAARH